MPAPRSARCGVRLCRCRTLQNLQQANTHVSEMEAQLHENEESLDALEKDTETKQQLLEQLRGGPVRA